MASARSGRAFGPIRRLFDEGTLTGLTDSQLLDRFLGHRDEAAFAALVGRHGSMVLAVCRGVLKDMGDAEDAFQATFLVLYRRADGVRSAGSLGGWLYRVAYRVALRANANAARRRERSGEEVIMAAEAGATVGSGVDREQLSIIHAEIDRLPERYRAPIALCYLEGLSYEQAAHRLGWPIGTVGSRIARARELLRSRLTRRGVTATTAALSALLAREAMAAPTAWVEAATRAVLRLGAGGVGATAAGAVPAAVALSDQVVRRMLMIRLIQMTSVLVIAATAGLVGWASFSRGQDPGNRADPPATAQARKANEPAKDKEGEGPIRGRVLTPDGRPVRDARILAGEPQSGWLIEPVARTDADGRFAFDPAALPREKLIGIPSHEWKNIELTAIAPGYGPAWSGPNRLERGEVELRLVADDVPILGRVIDTQGRPLAGVGVHLAAAWEAPAGDYDALLRAGTIGDGQLAGGYYTSGWWTKEGDHWTKRTIRTGPDGRFRIDGVGRDRVVALEIEGPGIARGGLRAMTRPLPPSAEPRPVRSDPDYLPRVYPLYGATFDYVAVPSRPIEGIIRARGNGRPLAGTRVSAHIPGGGVQATTDRDGRFRLDGLPKIASYEIQVEPPRGQPYQPASTTVSDREGLKPIVVSVELARGILIRGRLIDRATGKSVGGKQAYYFKLPTNVNEGDGNGVGAFGPEGFEMTVPPGPALFTAAAEGTNLPYTRGRLPEAVRRMGVGQDDEDDGAPRHYLISGSHVCRMVDVPADVETFDLDLELTRGAARKGRLVDPDGRPVIGAQAYALTSDWRVQMLDGADFEVIGLEPGKVRMVCFMQKDRRLAAVAAFQPGGGPVEVRLVPCGSAVGRVLDQDGRPLAGAMVGVALKHRRGEQVPLGIGLWPSGEFFNADDQGRFRIEGIGADWIVRLSIHPLSRPDVFLTPQGDKQAALKRVTAHSGQTVDLGEIRVTHPPNR